MRNFTSLTADKLRAIDAPELLFTRSLVEAKREYRELARLWHPDCVHKIHKSNAEDVFAHIAELYRQAVVKLCDGTWNEPVEKIDQQTPGVKKLRRTNGSVIKVSYQKVRPFELGNMYIAPNAVTFEIEDAHRALFLNGCHQIEALSFANEAMLLEMANSLPQVVERFKTNESSVVVVRKTPDQLLLADVLAHYRGKMKPTHVGWILNCLYNLACYLRWSKRAHNAISPESVFVSPLRHSVMLLGGWWYARPLGSPLTMVPERTFRFLPPEVLATKRTTPRTDLEAIKSIGRELLGDVNGTDLYLTKLPENLVDWLLNPSSDNALDEYRAWKHEVLAETFGKPRFIEMKLDTANFYKEN